MRIETYKGYSIFRDADGYFWKNGLCLGGGYFASMVECQYDIDCHVYDETINDPSYPPQDSSSLDYSFWRY